MIAAAAVCPQAPGLVPAVGFGIAAELADVRAACLAAIDVLMDTQPDRVVVVGSGADGVWDESAGGSFRGFGPDVRAGGPDLVLPPSLTVGAWLLDVAGWTGPRSYGGTVPDASERTGVLVMADGSSRHRTLAPEWVDTEGRAFDASVARLLAGGDATGLAAVDVAEAEGYGASGVDGLVALGRALDGASIVAQLRYDAAPFDVGYWVADWQVAPG